MPLPHSLAGCVQVADSLRKGYQAMVFVHRWVFVHVQAQARWQPHLAIDSAWRAGRAEPHLATESAWRAGRAGGRACLACSSFAAAPLLRCPAPWVQPQGHRQDCAHAGAQGAAERGAGAVRLYPGGGGWAGGRAAAVHGGDLLLLYGEGPKAHNRAPSTCACLPPLMWPVPAVCCRPTPTCRRT